MRAGVSCVTFTSDVMLRLLELEGSLQAVGIKRKSRLNVCSSPFGLEHVPGGLCTSIRED